jgi:SAM-dependent methyltransferase
MSAEAESDRVVPAEATATPAPPEAARRAQAEINAKVWSSGRFLASYDSDSLQPSEALLLARYREALTGRVLDAGCGAGRILSYLVMLGADAHGIDISSRMVEHCRERFPGVDVRVGDLANLKATVTGPFDAIVLADNVIDVFDDQQRRAVLADVRDLLTPGGLILFSSHNLDSWDRLAPKSPRGRATRVMEIAQHAAHRDVIWWIRSAVSFPNRRRNRRRLGPLQYREADHAVVNDAAHAYGLLHYYIGRTAQERQLSELGYRPIDVLEYHGPAVPPGQPGAAGSLYYVASAPR